PYPYLHFAWPQKIELEPLRRYPRFSLQAPLNLTAFSAMGIATAKLRGRFCDISLQGARVGLEKELTSAATKVLLTAKVKVADMEHTLELHGEIKRAFGRDEKAADNPFTYGVSFNELPPPQRLLMLAMCQELQSGQE
ncbi:MAG TPA: PilZ domain-containing protein, partial [Spongiibacteraceae bacterium]